MSAGSASAQDLPASQTTETTTTVGGPYGSDRSTTTTEHRVDSDGTEISKSKTYRSGDGALSADQRVQVTSPDGTSRVVEYQSHKDVPPVQTIETTKTTTTTTEGH